MTDIMSGGYYANARTPLFTLAQGERSVETLADCTGLSMANASQHLQQMRRAGLIEARRDGKFVYYQITDGAVLDLIAALTRIGERHVAEVGKIVNDYFQNRDSMEPVSRTGLLTRMKKGDVQVLDVRPEDEFALGHVVGAINIPLDKLKKKLTTLDPAKEVVAYCRGPYCVLSFETVAFLRSKGLRARRLEDGLPEWKAAGLPFDVASGTWSPSCALVPMELFNDAGARHARSSGDVLGDAYRASSHPEIQVPEVCQRPCYHCAAEAQSASSVWAVSKRELRKHLADNAEFAHAWAKHLAHEVQRARLHAEIVSLKTVAARIDAWIAWNGPLPLKGEWANVAINIGVSPEALYREPARRRTTPQS